MPSGEQQLSWHARYGDRSEATAAVAGQQNLRSDGKNFIGIRLPPGTPFLNAKGHVDSINDQTGNIRRQIKEMTVNSTKSGTGNTLFFNLNNDTRVLLLEVWTIYDGNHWVHPNPKMNMIATFRNMRSTNYTAK